jgi:signal transduction histidine kinase
MAATMAHEINNPLEAVVNLLYLVQRDSSLSERNRGRLELAEQELARVTHLTKQTLGFYRETGSASPLLVKEVVESLLTLYAPKLHAKNVSVEREYLGNSKIEAIPGEIRQVISNFLTNSLDAVSPNGRIIVRISDRHPSNGSSGVRVTVADNGCGISGKNLKRLFQPFFTTKKDVGTGLGLFVSKQIIEKHRGLSKFAVGCNTGRWCLFLYRRVVALLPNASNRCFRIEHAQHF